MEEERAVAIAEERAAAIADVGAGSLARTGWRPEPRERKLVYTEIVQRMF